jgi:hypothetical protein
MGFDHQLAIHYREIDIPIFVAQKATFKLVLVSVSMPNKTD